jgi:RNA polymerase sigma factor (TIGR02999 family)
MRDEKYREGEARDRDREDLLTQTLYGELRKLANARMRMEGAHTLQPTALVHEAWLRLGGDKQPAWSSRAQFFASAAKAMRRILIDRARRRQAIRHGGGQHRLELDAFNWEQVDACSAQKNDSTLMDLNESLLRLEGTDPETARLVEMYYFAGVKVADAAEALNVSVRTTERRLAYARAWLSREMEKIGGA